MDRLTPRLKSPCGRTANSSHQHRGDPIRNTDSLPTGRNLYGFDPSKIPTRAAWEAGQQATEAMITEYRQRHGQYPKKLAYSLWSVETMRHAGVLEAQAMAALGVRPKWDQGGRLSGVELIPAKELRRPRVDVVLSATGLYRDHFPNVMKWLAEAVKLAAAQNEPDNAVRAASDGIRATLAGRGLPEAKLAAWADTRIFTNQSGAYGTGLNEATLASDSFTSKGKEADAAPTMYLAHAVRLRARREGLGQQARRRESVGREPQRCGGRTTGTLFQSLRHAHH
ncbi:MAG: cobaltochelatase subunit CobN [Uliginosibacterium sp.]|nr:cobaltochelatase subunit CobN [Uliginosibacterium sp.]